jgi:hypothetical protein
MAADTKEKVSMEHVARSGYAEECGRGPASRYQQHRCDRHGVPAFDLVRKQQDSEHQRALDNRRAAPLQGEPGDRARAPDDGEWDSMPATRRTRSRPQGLCEAKTSSGQTLPPTAVESRVRTRTSSAPKPLTRRRQRHSIVASPERTRSARATTGRCRCGRRFRWRLRRVD